jgi:hypothetical protein
MAKTLNQFYNSETGAAVTDLSATVKLVTDWIFVGVGNPIGATFVWPATGSPVGVAGVEGSNDSRAGESPTTARLLDGAALDLAAEFNPAVVQPNVSAGDFSIDFESPADFLRYTYLRTSGGTGSSREVQHAAGAR